jgi:NADPH:quinone reductase-like Zn-dependent oxidoreductase
MEASHTCFIKILITLLESFIIKQINPQHLLHYMSSQFKTVLIVGATGDLGSKVTQAFLAKNQFEVRILVRGISDKAKELERKGARVVETDYSNLESLTKVRICFVFNLLRFVLTHLILRLYKELTL